MSGSGVAILVVLLVGVSALNTEVNVDKNRPVSKVINLLKDMVDQLEKEGEEDEEVYEVMGCWCKTNDKSKTRAIADGEDSINQLSSSIEDLSANSARLTAEIGALNTEVAKNTEALESATALRDKQLAEFTAEEKDMTLSINSLKGAVVALSKHHQAAFLQVSASARDIRTAETVAALDHELRHHAGLLTQRQKRVLASFVAAPEVYFHRDRVVLLQEDTKEPQSGEIFGILKAMKESFETNLAQSQKEETENAAAFEDLKAAKEKEIKAGQDLSETKTQELAQSDEKNAEDKQALVDARDTLAADTKFLADLKDKCQNVDHEYEERTKTRQMEITATSKALAFLSSDEAHDLFTRTFNPALLQRSSTSVQARKVVASGLDALAKKVGNPRLSALATSARLDAFAKVRKNISDMIEKLMTEKEDEIKKKDFCIEEINSNEKATESKLRDKGDAEVKVEDLRMAIDKLTLEIVAVKESIKEEEAALKAAGVNREKENKEFQVVVADQRATQKLIAKALEVLQGFYDKAALVQVREHTSTQRAGQAPPPGFKSYEKNSSAGGVTGMMESIIADAKAMEEEAVRGEEEATSNYEEFVAETKATIDAMTKEMTNKSETKSKAESDLVQASTEFEAIMGELDLLGSENRGLHLDCDFLLKNFEVRQSTRDDEVDALKQSLAIFSGASFSAFLQFRQ